MHYDVLRHRYRYEYSWCIFQCVVPIDEYDQTHIAAINRGSACAVDKKQDVNLTDKKIINARYQYWPLSADQVSVLANGPANLTRTTLGRRSASHRNLRYSFAALVLFVVGPWLASSSAARWACSANIIGAYLSVACDARGSDQSRGDADDNTTEENCNLVDRASVHQFDNY